MQIGVIQRHSQITIVKIQFIKAYGVIKEVEIRRFIFTGVKHSFGVLIG
ncbi:hypothetical protein HP9810_853g1 [Helicobacter pylori 98-10]|nr:hypothetical protein HP9810_853g1 [Helicobacter pylori 98-10]